MSERARLWQRVSSGGQDEANQLPDLIKWCDSHGYEYDLNERYVLHGKSASKGKHQGELDRAINDMAAGQYTILVVWQSSRIERRGAWSAFDLVRRVREAGGRIEYAKDAYLNETNEMSDVMLALAATKDRQKSQDISKQVKASHAALRSAGSVVGRPPWGYKIVERDGRKVLEPTAEARKYVPLMFARVIDGESVRSIAAWLDSEGVKPMRGGKWNETFLGNRLIKNPTYYGQRPNAGQLETQGLVSPTQWQEAQAALASRARPGRGTVRHAKPLVAPVCGNCYGKKREGCPSGISPMYRVFSQFKAGRKVAMFRCFGHGPQREGCGAPMAKVADVETKVRWAISNHDRPHIERQFIAGDDMSDRIAKLREDGAAAMRRGDYEAATAAMQEAGKLESTPRVAPHWVRRETGQSEADFFASLGEDEQRDYLAGWEVRLYVRRNAQGVGQFRVRLVSPYEDLQAV